MSMILAGMNLGSCYAGCDLKSVNFDFWNKFEAWSPSLYDGKLVSSCLSFNPFVMSTIVHCGHWHNIIPYAFSKAEGHDKALALGKEKYPVIDYSDPTINQSAINDLVIVSLWALSVV